MTDADRRAAHLEGRHARARTSRAQGRYASLGHYTHAAAMGLVPHDYRDLIAADLVDQLTTDTPGLVPEAWISDVVDLLGSMTPTVQAFSKYPLPTSGMVVNVPRVDQGPDVGPQPGEKQDIPTRKTLISAQAYPVKTYAGGQDVSIQELQRTEPAYLNILMRLFTKEMGIEVNKDANAALVAGTTASAPVDPADLNGSFIDAAASILGVTWNFPNVAVLGVNAWKELGKAVGTDGRPLFPHLSPVNPVGTFGMTDADGNVRGLGYYVDPSMDPSVAVIGIREAFVSMLGGIGTLTADRPQQLGRDVAVYQFATFGVVDARGLVKLTGFTGGATGVTFTSGRSSGSSKKSAD